MSSSGKGGGNLPLRSALKTDDDGDKTPPASGTLKAVQIAEPVPEYRTFEEDAPVKQFRTGHGRRLSGKMATPPPIASSSRSSVSAQDGPADDSQQSSGQPSRHHYHSEKLVAQISEWLERQQAKQAGRKKRLHHHHHRHHKSPLHTGEGHHSPSATNILGGHEKEPAGDELPSQGRERTDSFGSQTSDLSLDGLQKIVEESMASLGIGPNHRRFSPKTTRVRGRRRSFLHRTASSDTDCVDGDVIVPDCDVWLDNSKITGYSLNPSDEAGGKAQRERELWTNFKNEIIRTAHTLKLKGWRRVPLGSGETIEVGRISGALTNAVYFVTPPPDLPEEQGKKYPEKLLLRIYGPQADNLIDRETELNVLQRLARKKIGPRLLGTFKNGRFEQYFNASPLTPDDLRDPDVSKQIAKRMRELHDGIEVLETEREDGPAVWKNWDQWQDNTTRIMEFVDKQVETSSNSTRHQSSPYHAWKQNGYVCGVPWPQFKETVAKYRAFLDGFYRGQRAIKQNLVFAHNDTQHGNILRHQPDDKKSPLLRPANKHKQLIVIDFEYAAANMHGYEFANHFTEWTYNYHDTAAPWACNIQRYPKVEEQYRFMKAYVDHRPQFPHASSTPRLTPMDAPGGRGSGDNAISTTPQLLPTTSSSSIVDFMLDSRAPPETWSAAEKAREEQTDKQVRELLEETRLWRPANCAFWVAWGIVQAKIPGLEGSEPDEGDEEDENEESDEFAYLSYVQDRALLFWGDVVQLGVVKADDLPEQLRSRLKVVDH